MSKIAITTGDRLGIGAEITKKALDFLKPIKERVLIIGDKISDDYETLEIDEKDNGTFCFKSLELACALANDKKIQGIVTAPVSKYALFKSGYNYSGQTEILKEFLIGDAQMLFIAKSIRMMLLTRHLPLNEVKLDFDLIKNSTITLNNFLIEKCNIAAPKIGLCALNPHAGESGMLGREEIEIMIPAVDYLKTNGIDIDYPKSADGIFADVGKKFMKNEKQTYDAILASYHDQGLCPIKALAFDEAVNVTIGLNVIRTSPSCGVAYDIFQKGIANPNSMIEAIKLGLELSSTFV